MYSFNVVSGIFVTVALVLITCPNEGNGLPRSDYEWAVELKPRLPSHWKRDRALTRMETREEENGNANEQLTRRENPYSDPNYKKTDIELDDSLPDGKLVKDDAIKMFYPEKEINIDENEKTHVKKTVALSDTQKDYINVNEIIFRRKPTTVIFLVPRT